MERKFLEGFGLGKAEIDKIMAAHGAGLEKMKKRVAEAVLERENLAEQLANAALEQDSLAKQLAGTRQELAALSGLGPQAALGEAREREAALLGEAEALRAELEGERYAGRVRFAVAGERFSSGAARKAFEDALLQAGLPAEGEGLAGYEAFRADFEARDPGAFAPSGPVPRIVTPGVASTMAAKASGWREKAARNYERAQLDRAD